MISNLENISFGIAQKQGANEYCIDFLLIV